MNQSQLQAFLLTPDTTKPNLSVSHTADGSNGWNRTSPVTLNVSASEPVSGLEGDPTCTDGTNTLTLTAGSTAGTWTASVSGEGTHNITCSVSDKVATRATRSTTRSRSTRLAPSVSCSATPSKLRTSANNHKLVDIRPPSRRQRHRLWARRLQLVSVTSSQPDSGLGPDDVPGDIQGWEIGKADTSGQLRAERYVGSREYTLTYLAYDLAGNTAECKPTVTVPKGG